MACYSGITTGTTWSYTDCCGEQQSGFNAGFEVCVDTGYTYNGIQLSVNTCTTDCLPLESTFSVTGVCGNVSGGTVTIVPSGGVKPYTLNNIEPGLPTLSGATGFGPYTFTGLTGGTYVWLINDSTSPANQERFVNIIVGGCFCAEVYDVQGTTCGNNNGSIIVSGASTTAPYSIEIYSGGTLISGTTADVFPFAYNNFRSGVFYAKIYDSGGSSATTENFSIAQSSPLNFGFWQVNDTPCSSENLGKLTVTGLTGTGPYTYLWNNGSTDSQITGLGPGTYTVTVTDSLGCSTEKSVNLTTTDSLGVGLISASTVTCFTSDGQLEFQITGGTVPFYISGSTGQQTYTTSRTFVLTGLTAGDYSIIVTDSGLCKATLSSNIVGPGGFDVVSVNVTNSNCSQDNGSIELIINGSTSNNYIYGLTGQTSGIQRTQTTTQQSHIFSELPNDTYNLSISGTGSVCVYTTTKTLTSQDKFTLTTSVTGSTCGSSNGAVYVQANSGYTLPLDFVLSDGQQIIDTTLSATTFEGLLPGTYILQVTDGDNCTISAATTITTTSELNFGVFGTNCTNGNNASATVKIYEGEPPFTYQWNNGSTGTTITGLSGGTYSVIVIDSNGCSLKKLVTVQCNVDVVTSYSIVGVCNQIFETTSNTKRTMKRMLNEGFLDVSSGQTDCVLSAATFSAVVEITGSTGWVSGDTVPFYTGYTLNDYPQDSLWQQTIEDILDTIPEVGSYLIDLFNNTITINSDCDGDSDPLKGAKFKLQLKIEYDLNCVS
jgi:hypothetical protein